MTVQRRGDFPLHELVRFLEDQGWDVFLEETLRAVKEDADGVLQFKADREGRLYLRRTLSPTSAQYKKLTIDGVTYTLHAETAIISEVAASIDAVEAFPRVFESMMDLSRTVAIGAGNTKQKRGRR